MTTSEITSEPVYSWRQDIRRYHCDGNAIGALHPRSAHEWIIRATKPQSSGLPWTEFHTPRILAETTLVAGDWQSADYVARDWLEGQMIRQTAGDDIADVIDDFFTFAAATKGAR